MTASDMKFEYCVTLSWNVPGGRTAQITVLGIMEAPAWTTLSQVRQTCIKLAARDAGAGPGHTVLFMDFKPEIAVNHLINR